MRLGSGMRDGLFIDCLLDFDFLRDFLVSVHTTFLPDLLLLKVNRLMLRTLSFLIKCSWYLRLSSRLFAFLLWLDTASPFSPFPLGFRVCFLVTWRGMVFVFLCSVHRGFFLALNSGAQGFG